MTKTPHSQAAQLAELITSIIPFQRSLLLQAYDILHKQGDPQAVFNALSAFGVVPAHALLTYQAILNAIISLGYGENIPVPDPNVYIVDAQGNVTYTAPVVVLS